MWEVWCRLIDSLRFVEYLHATMQQWYFLGWFGIDLPPIGCPMTSFLRTATGIFDELELITSIIFGSFSVLSICSVWIDSIPESTERWKKFSRVSFISIEWLEIVWKSFVLKKTLTKAYRNWKKVSFLCAAWLPVSECLFHLMSLSIDNVWLMESQA